MSTAAEIVPVLDPRDLLRRINARLVALRRALGHDHRDEPFWTAFGLTVRGAQAERVRLRYHAHLLHVGRAMRRGRIHGRAFETLDQQRAWLAKTEGQRFPREVLDL